MRRSLEHRVVVVTGGARGIGESTARRLATYRHLADATIAGNGPDVPGGVSRTAARGESRAALGGNSVFAYIAIAVVVLIGVYLAVRFGAPH